MIDSQGRYPKPRPVVRSQEVSRFSGPEPAEAPDVVGDTEIM